MRVPVPVLVACCASSLLADLAHHIPPTVEQLPTRIYTTLDGLAGNSIQCVFQDSRGYMWFCTNEGLSRFDGYKFTNYGTEQGLPHRTIDDFLETHEGDYWVATQRGVCRFDPEHRDSRSPLFRCYRPYEPYGFATKLFQDRAGRIWCGTLDGLFLLKFSVGHDPVFEYVELGMPRLKGDSRYVTSILEDRTGALWIGSGLGLYRYSGRGRADRFTMQEGLRDDFIHDLALDSEGRIWVAGNGFSRLVPEPRSRQSILERSYSSRDGLRNDFAISLLKASDGTLWAGTRDGGLSRFVPEPSGTGRFETFVPVPGVVPSGVDSLGQDRQGNLWIGSGGQGVIKIVRSGFATFQAGARSLFASTISPICIVGGPGAPEEAMFLGCLEGHRFRWVEPWHPKRLTWGKTPLDFQDHTGEWWIATGEGLYRFPRVARVQELEHIAPKAVYRTGDGLPSDVIYRLFEDSRGDIWISTVGSHEPPESGLGLVRWERASETIHGFPEMNDFRWGWTNVLAEDRSGDVWIGIDDRLVRFRDGRFCIFGLADGVPASIISALHADSTGRLWIGTSSAGVLRLDSPAGDHPRFVSYSTHEGLSSSGISAIAEDRSGRIYVVTHRGVDRLELAGPRLSSIRHYSETDGLPSGNLDQGWCDREGVLWFKGPGFLARLVPQQESPPAVPITRISALQVNGTPYAISELGETAMKNLRLRPNQNSLQLDFAAISFATGESLRYQHWLEGADRDWSPPAEVRTVNYANLSPGAYTFHVRAINGEGVSASPAEVKFVILAPIWRRWWFVAALGIALALATYALHHSREAQLLGAVEQMRARIATDLHDDIGSSLSQIAMLSEVARRKVEAAGYQADAPLSDIAAMSGELVDTMGDIVWAINPKHDRLSNLEYRMRRFASDILSARDIDLEWRSMTVYDDVRISLNVRRQVFLIFKEAVNNIARHSAGTRAGVEFAVADDKLELHLADDGRGFNPATVSGNGLVNMRKRAADLGGGVTLDSALEQGTSIKLRIPLARGSWWANENQYRF